MFFFIEESIEFFEQGPGPLFTFHCLLLEIDEFVAHRLHCVAAGYRIQHLRLEMFDQDVCVLFLCAAERRVRDAEVVVQTRDSAT